MYSPSHPNTRWASLVDPVPECGCCGNRHDPLLKVEDNTGRWLLWCGGEHCIEEIHRLLEVVVRF